MTETIKYDTKATGGEIRKALRDAFPGVKFSLRMSRGTGYGFFDLSWTDGPTESAVRRVTDYFRSEGFDGMTDSTYRIEPKLAFVEGHELPVILDYSCRGVSGSRRFSDEAKAWAEARIREAFPAVDEPRPWSDSLPVPVLGHVLSDYGSDMACLVRRLLDRIDLTTGVPVLG